MSQPNLRRHRRIATRLYLALTLTMLAAGSWLRGEHSTDDRGSDASEKALMVILAVTIGGLVTVGAVAFINSKTALFK